MTNRTVASFCLATTLAFAACIPAARAGTPAAAGDRLFIGTNTGIRAIDPSKGTIAFNAGQAIALPDWSALVRSTSSKDTSRVTLLDAKTGAARFDQKLAGDLEVRVVSADGRKAALMPPRPANSNPYAPVGRERTTIVVADVQTGGEPRRIEVPGNYEPEAFSSDNQAIFMVEWLPATRPDHYRVVHLSLARGVIDPVLTRTKVPNLEEMRGEGRQQVLAPDRSILYTLYTRQPDHVHARDMARAASGQPTSMVHAFVHTLSLTEGWAFCIDLPVPFGDGPSAAHTIAISPDGLGLYVADRASGAVARIDTGQFTSIATASIAPDPQASEGGASSFVSRDGTLFVASASGVVAIEGQMLRQKAQFALPGALHGIAGSRDGKRLYAGQAGQVAILDAIAGTTLGTIATNDLTLVRYVAAIEGSP